MRHQHWAGAALLVAAAGLCAGMALAQEQQEKPGKEDMGQEMGTPREARPEEGNRAQQGKDAAHPCSCMGEAAETVPYMLAPLDGAGGAEGTEPFDFRPLDTEIPNLGQGQGGQPFGSGVEPYVLAPLELR